MSEVAGPRPPSTPFFLAAGALLLVTFGLQAYFSPEPTPEPEVIPTEGPDAERAATEAEAREAARREHRSEATLHAPLFDAVVDNVGGGISHLVLTGERFRAEGAPLELTTTTRDAWRPMRIELPGSGIDPLYWDMEVESETSVVLRHASGGLEVTRRFTAGDGPYQLIEEVVVHNVGTEPRRMRMTAHAFHYVTRADEDAGMFSARSTLISSGLCRHDGEVTRKDREDLLVAHGYSGDIDFVGIENSYFAQVLAPMDGVDPERCGLVTTDRYEAGSSDPHGSLFEAYLKYPVVEIAPGGEQRWRVLSFFGPKDWAALEGAGHELTEVVNLGMLAVIARQFARLLGWIHGWSGNWGLAIILLTLFVRIALFPIVERQFRAMAPMRKLKPELDEINKRFPDDLEKRQAAMMDLYRRHGVSPFSQMIGCLPILLQMPVFFALYTSLSTNVELYNQPFALWWQDLSAPDPYFVLPLMLVGLMHLQQRMTPAAMDPQQQKIMMIVMPVMMGFFMLFLPSGLCLYMMTNSVLGIGQQQLNQWRLAREDASKTAPTAPPQRPGDESAKAESPTAKENASGTSRSPKRRPSRG